MARTKGATADKFWSDAVRLAVYRQQADDEGKIRKRLNIIADKLCQLAIDGDMVAIKEIGDRLDGKPKTQAELSGPNGGPIQMEETGQGAAKLAAILDAIASRQGGGA